MSDKPLWITSPAPYPPQDLLSLVEATPAGLSYRANSSEREMYRAQQGVLSALGRSVLRALIAKILYQDMMIRGARPISLALSSFNGENVARIARKFLDERK